MNKIYSRLKQITGGKDNTNISKPTKRIKFISKNL